MAYRLHYSDYSTTAEGPPDPERWIGPPGPVGPQGAQGVPGPPGPGGVPEAPGDGTIYGRGGTTPAWVPALPLTGGTVTGPTTIQRNVVFTPTTGGTIGLAVSCSISGTMGNVGGVAPFEILISSNSIDSTANPGSSFFAQTIQHNFGATKGGQGCLNMVMTQTADVLDTGTVFINPLFVQLFANKGGGGAGNAIASASSASISGAGWGLAEATETGMLLAAGASVQQAYIETFVWNAAVRPTAIDAANCYISNPGNAFGTRAIWQIGRNGSQWPLDAAGWLLTTAQQVNNNPGLTPRWPQAAAGGLDFSRINFSTAALRTSGVALGNATVTIGTGRLSEGASGLVIDALGQIGAVASIAAGGSLYQVNDQLYDGYGGILLVTAVSSGAVTAASYIAGREPYVFVAPPANPLVTTGGSGSGATINVTWTARTGLSLNPGGGTTTFGGPVTLPSASAVLSFNTRTGPVSLSSADVTTALTFTPYNATNPSGYQTSAQVVTALAAGNPGAFSTLGATGAATLSGGGTFTGTYAGAHTYSGAVTLSGTVSGAALTTYLASPAAIGGTAAAAGAFTTLGATGAATLGGGGTLTGTFAGSPTFSGALTLSAAGTALSVTANATVGGTLGVTGASTLTGAAGFANGISFGAATGASNTDNSKHIILNTAGTTYGINVTAGRINYSAPGAGVLHGFIAGGVDRLTVSDTIATFTVPTRFNGTIGFNNTAPVAKPTVSGAKGSNAALASLMTALAAYGLVTDSTTA